MEEMLNWYVNTRLCGNVLCGWEESLHGFRLNLLYEGRKYDFSVTYGDMLTAFFEETKRVMG